MGTGITVASSTDLRVEAKAYRSHINKAVHANGGETWVFDLLAAGVMLSDIAKRIGVPRSELHKWANSTPERSGKLARAREAAADCLVEDVLADLDSAVDPFELKKAEVVGKAKQWTAGKWNRDKYGDGPQVQVNITADNMHLDALRNRG